jgi:glycosyltransferase involved in cell wall biosynthesis
LTSAELIEVGAIVKTRRRLHVVHVIEDLGPGGAERLLYTNLKNLDSQRIRSTVVTVYPRATHWSQAIRDLGVPVISLECQTPRNLLSGIRRFRSWLAKEQPDLIHSHLWAANVIARVAGRLAGIPVISSIHNPDHEPEAWNDGADVSLGKRLAAKTIDRWTSRFGNQKLIAVSDYVRRSAHKSLKFPLGDIELLYNPIDVDQFSGAMSRERAELLRECGLPKDTLLLVSVGRVSPQKGLLYALRALPAILESYPAAHLVSVGATTDRECVARLTNEAKHLGVAGHFHLIGARRDVIEFLRAADVFLFPSLYEGLGIALIEAMAAGCACVASDAGPIPEIISDGQTGILVPSGNSDALAEAVTRLLASSELRSELGTAARQTALQRFQPQPAADYLTEIYERVARARIGK